MPKSKSGRMFANPQVARMHDRAPEPAHRDEAKPAKPSPAVAEELPHAHKVEIHHPDGPENPTPGKFHTIVHPSDGSEPVGAEHDDYDSAEAHMAEHMGGDHEEDAASEEPYDEEEEEYADDGEGY